MILVGCAPAIDIASTPTQGVLVAPSPSSSPDARATQIVLSRTREAEARIRQTLTGPVPSSTPEPTMTYWPTATPTPTPTLISVPPLSVRASSSTPHPLAITTDNAHRIQELQEVFGGAVQQLVWSPDGQTLAVVMDSRTDLYDVGTLEVRRSIATNRAAHDLSFRPDGKRLAIAVDTQLEIWDVFTEKKLYVLQGEKGEWIGDIAYSQTGQVAACLYSVPLPEVGDTLPHVIVWQEATGQIIYEDQILYQRCSVDLSPDGKTLASSEDVRIVYRDIRSGAKLQALEAIAGDAIFSPDGSQMVFKDFYGEPIHLLNITSAENQSIPNSADCYDYARNQAHIICYSETGISFFDSALVREDVFRAPGLNKSNASVSPNSELLAVFRSGELEIWDFSAGQMVGSIPILQYYAMDSGYVRLNGEEKFVIAAADTTQSIVYLIDWADGSVLRTYPVEFNDLKRLALSPDGQTLAVAGSRDRIDLWNINESSPFFSFPLNFQLEFPLFFSPDGTRLATYQFEWNLTTGQTLPGERWKTHFEFPYHYNADGDLIAWRYSDEHAALVYANLTKNQQTLLRLDESQVGEWMNFFAAATSPDNRYVAAYLQHDGLIFVWDLDTEQIDRVIDCDDLSIGGLAFSPTSNLLISFGGYQTRLWDIQSGNEIKNIAYAYGRDGFFTPDGRFLVIMNAIAPQVWGLPPFP